MKEIIDICNKVVENGKITGGYFGKSRWNDVMGCIVASQLGNGLHSPHPAPLPIPIDLTLTVLLN